MTAPLVLLAIPSAVFGLFLTLGGPPLFGGTGLLTGWLEPVFKVSEDLLHADAPAFALFGIDGILILLSVAAASAGLAAGIYLFSTRTFGPIASPGRPELVERIATFNRATRFLYHASFHKWWFDELNDLLFIRIGGHVAAFLWWFDRTIVDGTVNAVGLVTRDAGGGLRRIQTGRVQNYALGIAIGLLVMAGSFLVIVGR
jgi:NADH-quinone oxidoreductase subunit L